jgi:hypothetical protein
MTVYAEVLREMARYLEQMEAPRPVIDRMLSTSAADVHWVDAIADDWGEGLVHPPSYVEWINAKCGSFGIEERKRLLQLGQKANRQSPQKLGAAEAAERDGLGDKDFRRRWCESVVVQAEREILIPPP